MESFSLLSETDYITTFSKILHRSVVDCIDHDPDDRNDQDGNNNRDDQNYPFEDLFCKRGRYSLTRYINSYPGNELIISLLLQIDSLDSLLIFEKTFHRQKKIRKLIIQKYPSWLLLNPQMEKSMQNNLLVRSLRFYRKHCDELAMIKSEWLIGSLYQVKTTLFKSNETFCLRISESDDHYLHYLDFKSCQVYDQLLDSLVEVYHSNRKLLQELQELEGDPTNRSLYVLTERLRIINEHALEFQNVGCPFFEMAGGIRLTLKGVALISSWIFSRKDSNHIDIRDVFINSSRLNESEEDLFAIFITQLELLAKCKEYRKISYWSWKPKKKIIVAVSRSSGNTVDNDCISDKLVKSFGYRKDKKRMRKQDDQVIIVTKNLTH